MARRMGWDINRVVLCNARYKGVGVSYIRNVIDRQSANLQKIFPDMRGLSPRNLKYMRAFALAWPDRQIVQQLAAQVPWFHNCVLLDKIAEQEVRLWYARKAKEEGWSRSVLVMQIESQLQERQGKATGNFSLIPPPGDSDMAAQIANEQIIDDHSLIEQE